MAAKTAPRRGRSLENEKEEQAHGQAYENSAIRQQSEGESPNKGSRTAHSFSKPNNSSPLSPLRHGQDASNTKKKRYKQYMRSRLVFIINPSSESEEEAAQSPQLIDSRESSDSEYFDAPTAPAAPQAHILSQGSDSFVAFESMMVGELEEKSRIAELAAKLAKGESQNSPEKGGWTGENIFGSQWDDQWGETTQTEEASGGSKQHETRTSEKNNSSAQNETPEDFLRSENGRETPNNLKKVVRDTGHGVFQEGDKTFREPVKEDGLKSSGDAVSLESDELHEDSENTKINDSENVQDSAESGARQIALRSEEAEEARDIRDETIDNETHGGSHDGPSGAQKQASSPDQHNRQTAETSKNPGEKDIARDGASILAMGKSLDTNDTVRAVKRRRLNRKRKLASERKAARLQKNTGQEGTASLKNAELPSQSTDSNTVSSRLRSRLVEEDESFDDEVSEITQSDFEEKVKQKNHSIANDASSSRTDRTTAPEEENDVSEITEISNSQILPDGLASINEVEEEPVSGGRMTRSRTLFKGRSKNRTKKTATETSKSPQAQYKGPVDAAITEEPSLDDELFESGSEILDEISPAQKYVKAATISPRAVSSSTFSPRATQSLPVPDLAFSTFIRSSPPRTSTQLSALTTTTQPVFHHTIPATQYSPGSKNSQPNLWDASLSNESVVFVPESSQNKLKSSTGSSQNKQISDTSAAHVLIRSSQDVNAVNRISSSPVQKRVKKPSLADLMREKFRGAGNTFQGFGIDSDSETEV